MVVSVWSLATFWGVAVTLAGRSLTVSAMSPSKPASRVAVTINLVARPRTASGRSHFAARVNGGFGVTPTPTLPCQTRGGTARLPRSRLTAGRVLANVTNSLPSIIARARTLTSYGPGARSTAARTGNSAAAGGSGWPAAGGGDWAFSGTVTAPLNPVGPTTLTSIGPPKPWRVNC